ncbi:Cytochrome P450 [Dillenia turbinata]|uniref:Cytochrome P450 n=1 Tax=Dillenia turbinata TaxID=194707 RepID=A0AAN8V1S3_9MAGN
MILPGNSKLTSAIPFKVLKVRLQMLVLVTSCLVALVVISVSHRVYRWRNPKCKGKLPPGSMGIPIIGETIQFFTPYKSDVFDLSPFIKKRAARYGSLFRTSVVGQLIVVSTDPDLNHYVFQNGKLFQLWYTNSSTGILGKESIAEQQGLMHKHLRNLVLNLVGPGNLKENLLKEMDTITRMHFDKWAPLGTFDVKEESGNVILFGPRYCYSSFNMIFNYGALKLISYDESKSGRRLQECYTAMLDGIVSFPLNIPGTAFHKCMEGRKRAVNFIKETIDKRRMMETPQGDFLDLLLKEMENKDAILTEEIVLDLIFLLLFLTFESTSSAITVALKFIKENPAVLAELTNEHEAILQSRAKSDQDSGVTWKEYKSMTFTSMVINETVRLANIATLMLRKTVQDVEFKGYTIPAGWLVMVCPGSPHLNPVMYHNPLEFNPWRWEGQELHSASKNFIAFGGGARHCAGADFAKLQTALFIHHLVTKYRLAIWTIVKGGEIVRKPGLVFPNGLHIKISEKNEQ